MYGATLLPSHHPEKGEAMEMNEDMFCIYFYRFIFKLATPDISD